MGKKTRKTRWRTLSIGEGPSDCESQTGDGAKPRNARSRWHSQNGVPGAQPRYNSSHSTPTRQNRHYYNAHNDTGNKWGPGSRVSHPNNSTRSSSTASETKITFNEDEYTKITTPRQDVLFKKGYLSKPKPHLQRPLTSAGNSTGDGTPDHQSADGADYPENDFDPPFLYPTPMGNSYIAGEGGIYYLNTYDPVPAQPLLLYDQFGNATLCYPPPPAPQLHPAAYSVPAGPRIKRYSVDSMTESTSPNNETNEINETFPETEEVFEGVKAFPGEERVNGEEEKVIKEENVNNDSEIVDSKKDNGEEEKKLRKKRRRRKEEEEVNGEEGDLSENENETEEKIEESKEEETVKERKNPPKCIYRVDAEEFIPRGYIAPPPPVGFVPLLPHDLFPGAFVLVGPPPPASFYPLPLEHQTQENYTQEELEESEELEEEPSEDKPTNTEPETETTISTSEEGITNNPPEDVTNSVSPPTQPPPPAVAPIDIAKIVSKLEQAALEQKRLEAEQEKDIINEPNQNHQNQVNVEEIETVKLTKKDEKVEEKTQTKDKNENKIKDKEKTKKMDDRNETNKTEIPKITVGRYADRLKTNHQPSKNVNKLSLHVTTSPNTKQSSSSSSMSPRTPPAPKAPRNNTPCPRLERSISIPKSLNPSQSSSSTLCSNSAPPDQWISVSGKKKRKTKSQQPVQEVEPVIVKTEPSVEPQIEPPKEEENLTVTTTVTEASEVAVVETSTEKTKKEKDRNRGASGHKKAPKKRIIVTDGALQLPVQTTSPIQTPRIIMDSLLISADEKPANPTSGTPSTNSVPICEVLINSKPPEEEKIAPNKVEEVKKVDSTPKLDQNVKVEQVVKLELLPTTSESSEQKKSSKKKKNKSKTSSFTTSTITSTSSTNKDLSLDVLETKTGSTDPEDISDDMSLELERMIQRGLYSTLEQRLVAHNPDDRFLATLAAPRMRPPRAGTPPSIQIPLVTSPMLPSPPPISLPSSNTISSVSTSTVAASGAITRAVREWMTRTRETTPEVEIFRRPQELRPEVLRSIEPISNNDDTIQSDLVEELEDDLEEYCSDDDIDRTAKDAASLVGDLPRSRSQSVDMLQYWEYEVDPSMETPVNSLSQDAIEPAEDALEQYESIYGQSGDFDRIQSEVRGLRPRGRPRARADPAYLPYRAICCTVM